MIYGTPWHKGLNFVKALGAASRATNQYINIFYNNALCVQLLTSKKQANNGTNPHYRYIISPMFQKENREYRHNWCRISACILV